MKRIFVVFLVLFALVGQSLAQTAIKVSSLEEKIAEGVTAKQLSEYLHFVASDDMQGRNTPSTGLNIVARFLALNLERWGFKPAGDNGTYFQDIALSTTRVDPSATSLMIDGQALAWGTDFQAIPTSGSASNAPVVWGGNGFFVKGQPDPLAGVDVKGKIVVVYSEGLPRGMTFQQFRAVGRGNTEDPATHAKNAGAVGVIMLGTPNTTSAAAWERTRRTRENGGNFSVDKFRPATTSDFPSVVLSQKASEAL
ncbi:MAG: hypothetical protein JO314_10965, partial [Acidobacteria bacterium]|nr:hypothetical protein [Acidobacteriota bacterium]